MNQLKIFVLIAVYILITTVFAIAQVNVSIPDTSAERGKSISIPIIVSNIVPEDSIISYQFIVTFDENVLDAIGTTDIGTLTETDDWSLWSNPDQDGQIIVCAFGYNTHLSGSGILVKLNFNVVGNPEETTDLSFSSFLFNDGRPSAITGSGTLMTTETLINIIITTNIGSGTQVTVDGDTQNAPYSTQWYANTTHTISVDSLLDGSPGVRYVFNSWSHGGTQTQDVTPTTNMSYIAELETQFHLEVKDDPSGVVNPTGSGWYSAMEIVKLDSLPKNILQDQTSFRFIKWQVDGIDSMGTSISILMDKPHTVVAAYQQGFYISGNIKFFRADPVLVTLNISGREKFSVNSNQDGSYFITGLLSGDYIVALYHPDYYFEPTNRIYYISKNTEHQNYFAFSNPISVILDDRSEQIPDHYELSQNSPNPFIDRTVIEYKLQQKNQVKLRVYNVLGQVVRELVDIHQPAGRHRIQWDRLDCQGLKVLPGVYFYRIEAGNFVQIKKMIVL